jgi:phage head-tail adaptor, putative, SPP1 family
LQAGLLKHKITIQHDISDGTEETKTWTNLCTVWAAKKGLTGRLYYSAAAAQSENDVIFTIRYRADIKPNMHIILGTESAYEITSEPVDIADNHQWLEIHARRIDTNGG